MVSNLVPTWSRTSLVGVGSAARGPWRRGVKRAVGKISGRENGPGLMNVRAHTIASGALKLLFLLIINELSGFLAQNSHNKKYLLCEL